MAKRKYRMAGLPDLLYGECGEIVESVSMDTYL